MSYDYKSVLMRGAVLAAAAVISTSALADADLDAKIADPANWASQAGDYSNHRHSTLKQISESNVGKLQVGIERVAAGQAPFRDVGGLYPGLRVARCEHHFVFCLPREGAPALVVAIFHERMDLMVRLADRLS